jgi:hypothetical protein
MIKDLEMGRLIWITQVGPKCHPKFPCKRSGTAEHGGMCLQSSTWEAEAGGL